MRIVLIGPRGSGKSTVAALLAEMTGLTLVSTDERIAGRTGLSIAECVSRHGWDAFRDLEQAVLSELIGQDGLILDCGGGVVERKANRTALARGAFVVFLTGSARCLALRIAGDADRPALTDRTDPVSEMEEVLEKRTPLYRELASIELNTDNMNPEELAKRIAMEAKTQ